MNKTVINGMPGTGKTETLIKMINANYKGMISECIVISYSRAAVKNIRERIQAGEENVGKVKEELPYFRTVHSICARQLDLKQDRFLTTEDIGAWMMEKHIDFGKDSGIWDEQKDGHKFLSMLDYIRSTTKKKLTSFSERERKLLVGAYLAQFGRFNRLINDIDNISALIVDYENYKESLSKMDYTDILLAYLETPISPGCKVLVVDEFQDMSPLIYAIVKQFEGGADDVYYAGDPWQSIYGFMGAEPHFLLDELKSATKPIILDRSYRLAPQIFDLAKQTINSNCSEKIDFEIACTSQGQIRRTHQGEISNLIIKYIKTGTVYTLTRTNWQKNQIMKTLLQEGIEFSELSGNKKWTEKTIAIANALIAIKTGRTLDAEWVKALVKQIPSRPYLKHGIKIAIEKGLLGERKELTVREFYDLAFNFGHPPEDLVGDLGKLRIDSERQKMVFAKIHRHPEIMTGKPKCSVGTIHSSKGLEADTVILQLDLSNKIQKQLTNRASRAAEARAFYTGITRTKGDLWLVGRNDLVVS